MPLASAYSFMRAFRLTIRSLCSATPVVIGSTDDRNGCMPFDSAISAIERMLPSVRSSLYALFGISFVPARITTPAGMSRTTSSRKRKTISYEVCAEMPLPTKSLSAKNSGRLVGQKSVIELPMNTTLESEAGSSIMRLLSSA